MRSTYYPGVCTKPGTCYQGCMRSTFYPGARTCELNQVLTKQVLLHRTVARVTTYKAVARARDGGIIQAKGQSFSIRTCPYVGVS